MNWAEQVAEERRGVILVTMLHTGDYSCSDREARYALDQAGILHVTSDLVRDDLTWLERHGLLTMTSTHGALGPVYRAVLTQRGCEVAEGRERVPGIRRPLRAG